ncbi:hypothetical protein ACVWYF_004067 [Hymenobacter sp. UYAg731]
MPAVLRNASNSIGKAYFLNGVGRPSLLHGRVTTHIKHHL